jgi:hypothetical protein
MMAAIRSTLMDKVISLAEWKAKQRPQRRKVPVYTPVPDPNGGYRLELVEWVEWIEAVPLEARVHLSADDS